MKRLTTDTPSGNFETVLNFVHGKDGWAHIYDADGKEVNLITWALNHCHDRGCDDFQCKTLEEYDEALSSCMMDFSDCPIALTYCFASQAVHLRDRLKLYEDILFSEDGKELVSLDALRTLATRKHGGRDSRANRLQTANLDGMAELLAKEGCCHLVGTCEAGMSCYDCWRGWLRGEERSDE